MLKLMILGRRAPGSSRHQAMHHLREVHGRLVLLPPPDAGAMPADYVQNHILDGVYPGEGAHAIERDLFTQICFDDLASLQASTNTPYYLASLKPDEPRFVDNASVIRMLVREATVVDGPRGHFKAFFVIGATGSADAVQARLCSALASSDGLGALVCNIVLPPPDGSPPFAQLVFEAWFAALADARRATEQLPALLDALPPAGIDPARCLAVLAEEFTTARLKQHYADSTILADS